MKETGNENLWEESIKARMQLSYTIATMRTPMSPILSGITIGTGAAIGFLSNCSFATNSTVFSVIEPQQGNVIDSGMSFVLTRIGIRGLAEFLALTGHILTDTDIHHARLARYYIHDTDINSLQTVLSNMSDFKLNKTLSTYDAVHRPLNPTDFSLRKYLPIIGPCFDKNNINDIIAALKENGSTFALEAASKIEKTCPLAAAVTLRMIRLAYNKSIEECMNMEYNVATKFTVIKIIF